MEKVLETVEKYILYIVLGIFSFFVLSNYSAPYVVPKELLLVLGVSALILIWLVRMVIKGSLSFSVGKFDLGVLLLAVVYVISTVFMTPNKMEAYLLPGTTTFVVAGAVLYFLINQFDSRTKSNGILALFISGVVLALISLMASVNLFSKIPQLPAFIKDATFNPLGGAIPTIIFLSVVFVFSIGLLLKEKDMVRKIFYSASIAVIFFSLLFLINSSLPGKPTTPRFVSMQDSWEVTIESLKKSPLLGVGPANYLTAFNLFRSIAYNKTDLWQVRFTTASNFYFTMITETGFMGLFALAVLLISIYKFVVNNFKDYQNPSGMLEKLSLVLLIVLFALLPVSPAIIVFLFAMLGLFSKSDHRNLHLNVSASDASSIASSRIPAMIVALPFLAGVIAVMFVGTKTLSAETTFKKSLDAISANDAKTTYDLMNKAINQNPKVDRYHSSFAQVNMALATSLASQKTISDTDRATISQLVQQAISEGKATVALNPGRSGNWEVLAQIYRSIMPFAQGADQFAIQTYNQAISLDPTNPTLRISLGGIYYSLGDFDNAIDSFKLAVYAKPDFPNAHYNLAIAYREKKNYDAAISEMNNVMNLVTKDSQDYKLAKQTLDELKSKKSANSSDQVSTESLTPPKPVEKTNIKPPITLPKEATPPATPSTNK